MLCALMYRQNGDLANLLKSARKNVPQSARLSAIAIWTLPSLAISLGLPLLKSSLNQAKHLILAYCHLSVQLS